MKKLLFILICVFALITVAKATSYKIAETDVTVDLDSDWLVFTRDNIKDNADLKKYNITEEYMQGVFKNNNAYLDAVKFVDDSSKVIEMFIRLTDNNKAINLSNYSDKEVKELAEEFGKEYNVENASVYKNNYKWVVLEHMDNGKYLEEYITIVNGKNYNLSFQNYREYTEEEKTYLKGIIDKAVFDVEKSYRSFKEKNNQNAISKILVNALKYGIIGAVVGAITAFIKKKQNKEENKNE